MSIEIRQMLIKSHVVQRAADGADGAGGGAAADEAPAPDSPLSVHQWRAECRRLIGEEIGRAHV